MKTSNVVKLSIIFFFLGTILFAYFQGWIIIRYPYTESVIEQYRHITSKKKTKLQYWHHDTWNTEETELIWSDDKAENIRYLINSLLTLMHEEEALTKKISLETVMLSPTGNEAFLSFDRNPFRKEAPTFEKLMIIESILKTVRENESNIHGVRFLLHHKPVNDYHLDFSNSWVINQSQL
jgi:hypothetical protein